MIAVLIQSARGNQKLQVTNPRWRMCRQPMVRQWLSKMHTCICCNSSGFNLVYYPVDSCAISPTAFLLRKKTKSSVQKLTEPNCLRHRFLPRNRSAWTVYYSYRIIRRRVIWLIGCWIGVKFSTSQRHFLYEAILPLLQPTEDMVVRIEAAATLKADILCKLINFKKFCIAKMCANSECNRGCVRKFNRDILVVLRIYTELFLSIFTCWWLRV